MGENEKITQTSNDDFHELKWKKFILMDCHELIGSTFFGEDLLVGLFQKKVRKLVFHHKKKLSM